jgi:indolepyruvate ferredoxin oxidoreductase beta subunit
MKQQIIISGIGGQGVLFVTQLLAEAAIEMGREVLTSETHGMAMRGGTVISHVKVGSFTSPLIRTGQADIGLFLHTGNVEVHRGFLKPDALNYLNAAISGNATAIDATSIARKHGAVVIANLVLLGCAVRHGCLFCDTTIVEKVLRRISPVKQLALNLEGFYLSS